MIYATKQDIIDLHGEDALIVADRDGDGQTDEAAIDAALLRASDEIDAYIGARHELPLPIAPPVLVNPCVDIALYRLVRDPGMRTEEDRTRFKDAIAFVKDIAEGRARLNLPAPENDAEDGVVLEGPQPIVQEGPERIFSRTAMRDL